jgi:hypothetical protein
VLTTMVICKSCSILVEQIFEFCLWVLSSFYFVVWVVPFLIRVLRPRVSTAGLRSRFNFAASGRISFLSPQARVSYLPTYFLASVEVPAAGLHAVILPTFPGPSS